MDCELTAAAQRVFAEAACWASGVDRSEVVAPALLLGLLAEPECQAAIILGRHGICADRVCDKWPSLIRMLPPPATTRLSADIEASLAAASRRLYFYPRPLVFATEHLLLGLAAADHETGSWLRQHGLDPDSLEREILERSGFSLDPLPLDNGDRVVGNTSNSQIGLPMGEGQGEAIPQGGGASRAAMPPRDLAPPCRCDVSEVATTEGGPPQKAPEPGPYPPAETIGALRVLDAAWNRAREGLRVVEDFCRFVLDDRHLTRELKQLRHDLTAALAAVPPSDRLAARETQADVGTQVSTSAEQCRRGSGEVLAANFVRLQEGLRSLEEFGKILDPDLAGRLKQLRYRSYTLQRAAQITLASGERLANARLYVLIDGRESAGQFAALVGSLVNAGVHIVQLRDKKLDDRRLLDRARLLRELTSGTATLFIMNDRPDLAVLAHADGVHVGQEELSVKEVRTIVGPRTLIGVSTHSFDQARQAVLDGADYIGVGPTFPSGTKQFERFPGVELLRQVACEIRLPAFAIGGITRENLAEVLATGMRRVAVSGAIVAAPDPGAAAREMLAALGSVHGSWRTTAGS